MPKKTTERTLFYGKDDVLVYRTYAKRLAGIKPIPESNFIGHDNVIFALKVKFAVYGKQLLSSFTEGDNTLVVATDSMKNFILLHAALYKGETIEGFLAFVSQRFMAKYSHIESISITGDRLPFDPVYVPGKDEWTDSGLVFRRSHNDHTSASMEITRTEDGTEPTVSTHLCGLADLQLIKVSGSSFYGFIRDEYTTLPESYNRPLYIYLNIYWIYNDITNAISDTITDYVPAEQIRDIAQTVFHEYKTPSIQFLIYQIGLRILSRFPQLLEVKFESNNRTWETVVETIEDSEGKVFTEARPPFGFQGFSMTRDDLKE
ncbi:urate oxidase [Paenibacillus psychroresistens]|uniref:Uricase n=1 Tax=Paenibacillus psychroresistens TaxID=1778678 RepID=A0A6B8RN64_9BACL|nr:urate oxidase [Paenibacillus psychroresistens]QGQ97142.1 urate oxidase [Paenibacillus psychroresistens]